MPSINLSLDYFDHRKTRRLMGILGKGAEMIPPRIWCYCGRFHRDDGDLSTYSADELKAIVGWDGDASSMLQALLQVGFLEKVRNRLQVHDWSQHAGHLRVYAERARTAALARKRLQGNRGESVRILSGKRDTPTDETTQVVEDQQLSTDASSMRQAVLQALPVQCSAVQCSAVGEGEGAALRPATGIFFPVAGRGAGRWELPGDLLGDLKRLYPDVDVERECDLAISKIKNGAVTKKTANGMGKFLHSWMSRAQNGPRTQTQKPQRRITVDDAFARGAIE